MPAGAGRERGDEAQASPGWLVALLFTAFALLVVWQFREALPHFATHVIGDTGDSLLQHLHCAWQWQALAEGGLDRILRLPTFHPYSSGLAFGEPLLGVSLPFAPVYLATGSSAAAYNAALVAAYLLLGLATFLWVRELFDSTAAAALAAVLVVFVPWRVQLLSNLNNMTVHFAVFGMWLLTRWAREPRAASLAAAVLCFHVQLVTSAQVAVASFYLTGLWFAVVWAGRGLALDGRRCGQLAVATGAFLLLAWPWWHFFAEAFEAARGLPRTREMQLFSSGFGGMARQFGLLGPLGACAALAVPVLLAAGGRRLPAGARLHLLGLCVAAGVLWVCGRGPYLDAETGLVNPGYTLTRWLPFLSDYRAPVRIAAFTPLVAAVVAAGGLAALLARRAPLHLQRLLVLAPLALAAFWPGLGAPLTAPIHARPADRALAETLAQLPDDAVVLSLPVDLEPSGAAVDERVLIHRRAQVGGFASVIPPVFRSAISEFGQWPATGHAFAAALGVTHVVAPTAWIDADPAALPRHGYREVARSAGHAVVAAPEPSAAGTPPARRVQTPVLAAAGAWLTLASYEATPRFVPAGHRRLPARWTLADGTRTRVEAFALLPGVVGPRRAVRVHVPVPDHSGPARLEIIDDALAVQAETEIARRATSRGARFSRVDVRLTGPAPKSARAGGDLPLDVELASADGPILLASSREDLPFRHGETLVLARYRSPRGSTGVFATPGLSSDLVPGQPVEQRWWLATPSQPGVYDLEVSFAAHGNAARPAPWVPLLRGLRVVAD